MTLSLRATALATTAALGLLTAVRAPLDAQITRHPTGVNVNATGPTSVFLTFGNLNGKIPVEAAWCGEIEAAAPAIGNRCVPSTLYGRLPIRYDRSRYSGPATAAPPPPPPPPPTGPTLRAGARPAPSVLGTPLDGMTDIMTIPASVARRAWQAAARGENSAFFYVRRFVDPAGGPDEYVTVTCRLTDGGARTPFALLDVQVAFSTGDPVLSSPLGEPLPELAATIQYNGTGRLRGRWEIVRPGEELPEEADLLSEAALPVERRRAQRRYTELARFDVFLPPGGPFTLEGPPADRLPSDAPGMYLVLLRIEASDDKEGDSDLGSAQTGSGVVSAGGVAGFPMPPLRYYVGEADAVGSASTAFALVAPAEAEGVDARAALFRWDPHPQAAHLRLELEAADGTLLLEAVLPRGTREYRAPPLTGARGAAARWRVVALTATGRTIQSTPWRRLRAVVPTPERP